jgi:hypothetical protein
MHRGADMRKHHVKRFGLGVVVAGLLLSYAGCPLQSPLVFFRDPNLEAAVRETLGLRFDFVARFDLLGLTSLDASERDISDLEGLQFATNLRFLDLSSNPLSNISQLEDLTGLETLILDGTEVFDLDPLAGLLNLQAVSLCDTDVADLTALVLNAASGGLGAGDYVVLDLASLDADGLADVTTLETTYSVNVVDCAGNDPALAVDSTLITITSPAVTGQVAVTNSGAGTLVWFIDTTATAGWVASIVPAGDTTTVETDLVVVTLGAVTPPDSTTFDIVSNGGSETITIAAD